MSNKSQDKIEKALLEFVKDIESTGGVVQTQEGIVPVADLEWFDLGLSYMTACEALGRTPKFKKKSK